MLVISLRAICYLNFIFPVCDLSSGCHDDVSMWNRNLHSFHHHQYIFENKFAPDPQNCLFNNQIYHSQHLFHFYLCEFFLSHLNLKLAQTATNIVHIKHESSSIFSTFLTPPLPAYNNDGTIVAREGGTSQQIDVDFHDITVRRPIRFNDRYAFSMAAFSTQLYF